MAPLVVIPLRERWNGESLVLCFYRLLDKSALLRSAGVRPGTYAAEIFENLYDTVVDHSLDTKADYVRYYAREYATYAIYLRKRLLWNHDVIAAVSAHYGRSVRIVYFDRAYSFLDHEFGPGYLTKLFTERRGR